MSIQINQTEPSKPHFMKIISGEPNAQLVYGPVEDFNYLFGNMLNSLGLDLLPESILAAGLKSIRIQSVYDYLKENGFTVKEYPHFDFYIKDNSSDITLCVVPFPHADPALFYYHFEEVVNNIDANIVFLFGQKSFFGTETINKTNVDMDMVQKTEEVLDMFPNTTTVLNTNCMGHSYAKAIIPLFEKLISYSPMIKRLNDFVMSPYEITDCPDFLPAHYFIHLFSLKQGLTPYPTVSQYGMEKINMLTYRQYYDRFSQEGDSPNLAKQENVLVVSPKDKIVSKEENRPEIFDKTIEISTPLEIDIRQMHGNIYFYDYPIKEYIQIINKEL